MTISEANTCEEQAGVLGQLRQFLQANIKPNDTRARNIDLICAYYRFSTEP